MKRASPKQEPRNKFDTLDDDYEFSEEYKAEEHEMAEVYSSISPYITFGSILLLILFTLLLVGMKLSGGKVSSPKEIFSGFLMPFRSDYYEMRVDGDAGNAEGNAACEKFLEDNGYSDKLKTSAFNRNTVMYLKQEDGRSYILPGAYGSNTFYIKPRKTDADLSIHIKYDVYGIKALDNGSLVKMSDMECSDNAERKMYDDVDELINGHILFFREKNDNKYSGLIENGEMVYRTSEHRDDLNSNGEYKIKVYWIWAEYYEQMVNAQADGALFDNSVYQDTMIDFISNEPDEFFYAPDSGEIPRETPVTDYAVLSDYYNNADKLIVENTNYFGFTVLTHAE